MVNWELILVSASHRKVWIGKLSGYQRRKLAEKGGNKEGGVNRAVEELK
jgi:hypothetical protein